MKSLLNRGLSLLAQGALMGLGIAASIYVVFQVSDYFTEEPNWPTLKEIEINSVEISQVRFVTFGRNPIVSFRLSNNTELDIKAVRLEFQLLDKNGLFGSCGKQFSIAPKSILSDVIVCNDFWSGDVPENTEAKVIIESVSVYDE